MIDEFTGDSWIKKVRYDTDTRELSLVLEASDNTYLLEGVEPEVFEQFKSATSRGKFFNENMRGKYVHRYFKDVGY